MSCYSLPEQRRVLAALRELITALDKRAPQPHRDRERHIVADAARLRHEAHTRIVAIEERLALRSCASNAT